MSRKRHIFDEIIFHLKAKPNHLRYLNRCLIFLRITILADILEGGGVILKNDTLQGKLYQGVINCYQWPNQQWPYQKAWITWRRVLKQLFSSNQGELISGLNSWINDRYLHWQ